MPAWPGSARPPWKARPGPGRRLCRWRSPWPASTTSKPSTTLTATHLAVLAAVAAMRDLLRLRPVRPVRRRGIRPAAPPHHSHPGPRDHRADPPRVAALHPPGRTAVRVTISIGVAVPSQARRTLDDLRRRRPRPTRCKRKRPRPRCHLTRDPASRTGQPTAAVTRSPASYRDKWSRRASGPPPLESRGVQRAAVRSSPRSTALTSLTAGCASWPAGLAGRREGRRRPLPLSRASASMHEVGYQTIATVKFSTWSASRRRKKLRVRCRGGCMSPRAAGWWGRSAGGCGSPGGGLPRPARDRVSHRG